MSFSVEVFPDGMQFEGGGRVLSSSAERRGGVMEVFDSLDFSTKSMFEVQACNLPFAVAFASFREEIRSLRR